MALAGSMFSQILKLTARGYKKNDYFFNRTIKSTFEGVKVK